MAEMQQKMAATQQQPTETTKSMAKDAEYIDFEELK